MLSHENLLTNACQCRQVFYDLNERDRFFSVLPLHHVYEGTAGFLCPVAFGAEITYARSLRSKELIEDMKATFLYFPPEADLPQA
jgi:long-chain acyl-CoA synthetase